MEIFYRTRNTLAVFNGMVLGPRSYDSCIYDVASHQSHYLSLSTACINYFISLFSFVEILRYSGVCK